MYCRGHGGDGLCEALTKYDRSKGNLFVQNCALFSDASDVSNESAFACISLFIFLVLRYVVTVVVCMRLRFV